MIALDTNVLVRFITQDHPEQGRAASQLMGELTTEAPGFVCRETLLELVWVLKNTYGFGRSQIGEVLEMLLAARQLVVEEADCLGAVLDLYQTRGFDFADLMIRQIALDRGADRLVTFDTGIGKLTGVEVLPS